jgi:glycerol kinase
MEFFKEASDSESLAEAAEDNGGIFFVPALAGLGAPYWDPFARGSIFGITRSTSKAHLTRAALESICFQVNTILELLKLDFKGSIDQVRVDGGASANNLLLQFQSDISKIEILSTDKLESTSLGVAYMAGIGVGFYTEKMLLKLHGGKRIFKPEMDKLIRKNLLSKWNEAIKRTMNWEN